jgi:hypothetical protein
VDGYRIGQGLRRAPLALLAVLACGFAAAPAASAGVPIRHVFVLVLENENESTSFPAGSPPSPYLAQTLPSMGVFVPNYYGIGHASLDNYVAMVSGQAPDTATQADCGTFSDFVPTLSTLDANGQATGSGCVYPASSPSVATVADQLAGAGGTWKGYMQSMQSPCRHPALNAADTEGGESATDTYATRHNPFMYFHSIIDSPSCAANVVNLDALPGDLASVATTPNYSFITPDVCSDGHDGACADTSRPGGYAGINDFLSTWVPRITSSPAFKQDGLLAVIFDESASDHSSCCGEIPGPNSNSPGGAGPNSGGGQVGAVLVSPFITPGTMSATAYNHYSLLGSVEDLFGLGRLGMAGVGGLPTFGTDIYNAPMSTTTTSLAASPTSAVTNQTVTLTATVSAWSPPSGTVSFANHGAAIAGCTNRPVTASGSANVATCQTSFTASSSPEALTAAFTPAGGSGLSGSTSPSDTLGVAKDATAAALSVSNATPPIGSSVTYTATVTPAHGGATPSGPVQFVDNGGGIGSCAAQPLTAAGSSSTATCTVSYGAAGSHSVTAVYGGDGNFTGSSSGAQTATVPAAPSTTTPTTPSVTPPACASGRSVTIRLPTGKKRLRKAVVKVNGRKVKIIGGKHPHVVVNLVGRPGTTVTVVITGRQGKHAYRSVRHYHPCHVG